MSIIQNTENYENENYEGENYEVMVYLENSPSLYETLLLKPKPLRETPMLLL